MQMRFVVRHARGAAFMYSCQAVVGDTAPVAACAGPVRDTLLVSLAADPAQTEAVRAAAAHHGAVETQVAP